jgi:2-phospho-L-lactate guanylyltransferase
VRIGQASKTRLAHIASPAEREQIARELFTHVVGVLRASGLSVIALAPHPLEDAAGAEVWRDEGAGLNASIDRAVERTGTPVLIVHADLPFITPDDVHALIQTEGDVVIARANDGGTNALLMRERISSAFGIDTALAHAARARSQGLRVCVVDRENLALDVDDEAALTAWRSSSSRPTSPQPSSFRPPAP